MKFRSTYQYHAKGELMHQSQNLGSIEPGTMNNPLYSISHLLYGDSPPLTKTCKIPPSILLLPTCISPIEREERHPQYDETGRRNRLAIEDAVQPLERLAFTS